MEQYVNEYAEVYSVIASDTTDISDIKPYDYVIIDALSRQIPIKPYYRREEDTEGLACPNCDGGVTADYGRIRDTYCSHCGQMIDWED